MATELTARIDDKERGPCYRYHLLAIGHNDMRQMHVGRMIGDKERVARFIMGDQGLRARHDGGRAS